MSIFKSVGKFLFGGGLLGLGAKLLGGGKQKALPAPQQVTRDAAAETIAADDALARRRGAAADMISGTGGSGAGGAGPSILGS